VVNVQCLSGDSQRTLPERERGRGRGERERESETENKPSQL
jgi:hypothetical protein